jgi:hypothetical protein
VRNGEAKNRIISSFWHSHFSPSPVGRRRCPRGKYQAYRDTNYCSACPGGKSTAQLGAVACSCLGRACVMTGWGSWSRCFGGLKYRERLIRSLPNSCGTRCAKGLASSRCTPPVGASLPARVKVHPGLPGSRSSLAGGLAIPQWFATAEKLTWDEASRLCAAKFMVLATRQELCPRHRPFAGALGARGNGGWIPVLDSGDGEYLYFGQDYDGDHDGNFLKACTLHREWSGRIENFRSHDAALSTWSKHDALKASGVFCTLDPLAPTKLILHKEHGRHRKADAAVNDDDCKVGAWGTWSARCVVPDNFGAPRRSCGSGGHLSRERPVRRPARLSGKSCPHLVQHKDCLPCRGVPPAAAPVLKVVSSQADPKRKMTRSELDALFSTTAECKFTACTIFGTGHIHLIQQAGAAHHEPHHRCKAVLPKNPLFRKWAGNHNISGLRCRCMCPCKGVQCSLPT